MQAVRPVFFLTEVNATLEIAILKILSIVVVVKTLCVDRDVPQQLG